MTITYFDYIYTQEDVALFINKLGTFKNALYLHKETINTLIPKIFSRNETNYLLKVLPVVMSTDKDISQVMTIVENIITLHQQMPSITLRVAQELSVTFIEQTVQWLRKEVKKPIVLNIVIDRKIIGGVVLEYKGFYKDFSVKKKLHDYLTTL